METQQLKPHILTIDDDKTFSDVLKQTLTNDYRVTSYYDPYKAMAAMNTTRFDLVLSDMKMPNLSGLQVLEQALDRYPGLAIIMLTAVSDVSVAVECIKAGALDYVVKGVPEFESQLRFRIERALNEKNLAVKCARLETKLSQRKKENEILGLTPGIIKVKSAINDVAKEDTTVLILGESGTGKELVATNINLLRKADRPFVAFNCGAISKDLIESELFGHVKGSFSGAISDKDGLFVAADGGDIFLDEVGDLPLKTQVALLRVIQERKVRPVGSNKSIPIDVRIITATNKDLEEEVRVGNFREDLYYRIAVFVIKVPSLRERVEDIPLIAEHLVKLHGKGRFSINAGAMNALQKYPWPGNIRELGNVIEKACVLAGKGATTISKEDIDFGKQRPMKNEDHSIPYSIVPKTPDDITKTNRTSYLHYAEKNFYRSALTILQNNKTQLAARLGCSRDTLYSRFAKIGLITKEKESEVEA